MLLRIFRPRFAGGQSVSVGSVGGRKSLLLLAFGGWALAAQVSGASAESIAAALASAYSSNPEINSARAQTRSIDENVPIAKAARRPTITAFSTITGASTNRPTWLQQ